MIRLSDKKINLLHYLRDEGKCTFDAGRPSVSASLVPRATCRRRGKTMIRKVDPVHFFNAMGDLVLTMGHQGEIIDSLLEENAKLKRLLKAAMLQLGAYADELSFKDTIN